MPTLKKIIDGSSKLIELSFYDEVNNLTTPISVTWTLKNENNEIINNIKNVNIVPNHTIYLNIFSENNQRVDGLERYVIVESTYNSSKTSENLNLNEVINYSIDRK